MKNDPAVTDISDLAGNRYPHLKLTVESFPRLLATRRIEVDGAEYFGAFLTKTAVRILIDLLNKTFRLRSCEFDIDGSFDVPCTQFYRRRCIAPCVAALCSQEEYSRLVSLLWLVLTNDKRAFRKLILQTIEERSLELDFEAAAKYRNILAAIETWWKKDRIQVWLDDTVDTFAVEDTADGTSFFLVSHRNRRVLGRKVFTALREDFETHDEALSHLIDSFYVFHLPREIRVSCDFEGRKALEDKLIRRLGRQTKIVVVDPRTKGINAYRELTLSQDENELDKVKPLASPESISHRLRKMFSLKKAPTRIEAFDVAHISGTGFVAASVVWTNGTFASELYRSYIVSEVTSELGGLANAVLSRLNDPEPPDLIILDGGKPQLYATHKELSESGLTMVPIVAAVKPSGKHASIAAFLMSDGRSIPFDIESPAHTMLQLLRDEAHNLANRIHRDYREMKPFYEAAGHAEPLIVPIRLHAPNGGAEDLVPIQSR